MKQPTRLALTVSLCFAIWSAIAKEEPPVSTVTFRVEDQTGGAISNATVLPTSYWKHGGKLKGTTDTNGLYTYEDRLYGEIACIVSKEGYYQTHGDVWSGPHKRTDHPTNALVVVLKKIINPVPMSFRRVSTCVPKIGEAFAFDLELGDWVEPYGNGKTKDVWFDAQKRKEARLDFDVRVGMTFSNALDGIQAFTAADPDGIALASDLMPPQQAPIIEYTNILVASFQMRPNTPPIKSWTSNRNYIFQVRGKKDNKNELVEANVGWIRKDIEVGPDDTTVYIVFSYYYNPDPHSRSLEPLDADKSQRRK
jgi:hypothetical protein